MKKYLPIIFILLGYILAFYVYPITPNPLASHWGIDGQVNGYMSKFWGLFLMPFISTFLYILFIFLPKLDPYQKNFSEFRQHYDNFMVIVFAFLFYIYLLTIIWNLGHQFNMIQFLSPAFSVLFYFTARLISQTKRNWFVGIRTPWTMNNPKVWQKTHMLGAKMFMLVSLSSFFGLIFPKIAFYLLMVPLFVTVFTLFVYSYVLYLRYNQL